MFPKDVSDALDAKKTEAGGCRASADPPGCGAGPDDLVAESERVERNAGALAGVLAVRRYRCRLCTRIWVAAHDVTDRPEFADVK